MIAHVINDKAFEVEVDGELSDSAIEVIALLLVEAAEAGEVSPNTY